MLKLNGRVTEFGKQFPRRRTRPSVLESGPFEMEVYAILYDALSFP